MSSVMESQTHRINKRVASGIGKILGTLGFATQVFLEIVPPLNPLAAKKVPKAGTNPTHRYGYAPEIWDSFDDVQKANAANLYLLAHPIAFLSEGIRDLLVDKRLWPDIGTKKDE